LQLGAVTINGDLDKLHWSKFPTGPNLHHLLIPDSGHNAAGHLKRAGTLRDLITAAFSGNGLAEWREDNPIVIDAPI
jgi:hypothetical protein